MILCTSALSTSDMINLLIFIVYVGIATLMYFTFKEGQKQTVITLGMAQFNIFQKELDGFIKEAGDIKFNPDLNEPFLRPYIADFEASNGIYYIRVLNLLDRINTFQGTDTERRILISHFRINVLTPLVRYYDKLYHFLIRISGDNLLTTDYKNILYNYVERDILTIYFRVCNYGFINNGAIHCDLSVFSSSAYPISRFYEINRFYIDRNLFQYKNIDFYKSTF